MGRFRGVQRTAPLSCTGSSRCLWVASSVVFEHVIAEDIVGMVTTHWRQADEEGHGGERGGGRKNNALDRGTERDQLDKVKKKMDKEMEIMLPYSPLNLYCHDTTETNV